MPVHKSDCIEDGEGHFRYAPAMSRLEGRTPSGPFARCAAAATLTVLCLMTSCESGPPPGTPVTVLATVPPGTLTVEQALEHRGASPIRIVAFLVAHGMSCDCPEGAACSQCGFPFATFGNAPNWEGASQTFPADYEADARKVPTGARYVITGRWQDDFYQGRDLRVFYVEQIARLPY